MNGYSAGIYRTPYVDYDKKNKKKFLTKARRHNEYE